MDNTADNAVLEVSINTILVLIYIYTVVTILAYRLIHKEKTTVTRSLLVGLVYSLLYPLHIHIPPHRVEYLLDSNVSLYDKIRYYILNLEGTLLIMFIVSAALTWILGGGGTINIKMVLITMFVEYHIMVLLFIILIRKREIKNV